MARFRKKPVMIEAFQMSRAGRADNSEWPDWLHEAWQLGPGEVNALWPCMYPESDGADTLVIGTLEGSLSVSWGDWIIRGVAGEIYPCKPDIFAATYEPVDDPPKPTVGSPDRKPGTGGPGGWMA